MSTSGQGKTIAEGVITVIMMAVVPVVIKGLSANVYTIGLTRLLLAIAVGFFALRAYRDLPGLTLSQWVWLVVIGFVFGIHWLTYFIAIKTATPSIAVLGTSSYGIHLIGLGWLFLRQKPGWMDLIAVTLAIMGNILVVPDLNLDNKITVGLLWGILSGFLFAVLPILHQRNTDLPNSVRAFGQFLFALPVFLFFLPAIDWQLSAIEWVGMLYLGLIGTLLAHSLWVRTTTRLPAAVSSMILYLLTPSTMLISYLALSEAMPWQKLAGAALIIAANVSGLLSRLRKKG